MEEETRPVFLPIDLKDVFELIEGGKTNLIYFVNDIGSLLPANDYSFSLDALPKKSFYVKPDYLPKTEQEAGKNETN
ncbi:hypothetical protein D920_01720 [Enterococcus faecalis 13-SD-W-01]|nr:hypothetical protein D920_01720 [Enterococcus faecalis 13-SD-W-01]